jgi:RNA polymerase sigma factor (sigma-70 family)
VPAAPNAAQVYRSLAPAVLGYLRSIRAPDPEDVLGEVFLQVTRDLPRFRGNEAALRRWIFSIAHNRAMDAHRRSSRRPPTLTTGGDGLVEAIPTIDSPDPFDPELVQALAELTSDQREVIVLRFVADLPLEAVAKITGRKVGAVKALQHRALENLEKAVSRQD